jgi:Xaa-Pro aminopeptidase
MFIFSSGPSGIRTHDLLNAIETRSQLRYGPVIGVERFYSWLSNSSTSGPEGIRTPDFLSAIEARSQLRYRPFLQQGGMIVSEGVKPVKERAKSWWTLALPANEGSDYNLVDIPGTITIELEIKIVDIDQAPYNTRQDRLSSSLQAAGIDTLALNPGPSLEYLTGLTFHLNERPLVALFSPSQPVIIVHAELESAKTRHLPFPVQVFAYGEDPGTWQTTFQQALHSAGLRDKVRIGIEPQRMRIMEFQILKGARPGAKFISAEANLASLRMYKDRQEQLAMRKAVEIAQNALQATLPLIKIGMTERELAAELVIQIFKAGSDPELPFAPIVSTGPDSANPHALPGDRRLTPGDLLVIDWGSSYHSYFSDLTRTFTVGKANPKYQRIAQVVIEANAAGRAAAGPAEPASEVDRAARSIIEKAGFGEFFTHRTGHGLGRESHEAPYIRSDNAQILESGMTFTIEPGIYLPEENGVRIEDDMLITENGAESLSNLPRELITVGD